MVSHKEVYDAVQVLKQYHQQRLKGLEQVEQLLDPIRSLTPLRQDIESLTGIEDLSVRDRRLEVSWARYMYMYHARKQGYTLKSIAESIGLHHTSVMHGLDQYNKYYGHDALFTEQADKLTQMLDYAV